MRYLVFLLSFLPMYAYSQLSLTGKVIDEKELPVEFVNVALFSLPDSSFLQGGTTDVTGCFHIEVPAVSKGYAVVSFVGYESVILQSVQGDVGTVRLNPQAILLQEAVVTVKRPIVVSKPDRLGGEYLERLFRWNGNVTEDTGADFYGTGRNKCCGQRGSGHLY